MIRRLVLRTGTRWEKYRDKSEVFAELKRDAIYKAIPYGIACATWKAVQPQLAKYLPTVVYQGLSNGINTYAIPLAGIAIAIYIAWRGWTAYRALRRLKRLCQSSGT